MARSVLPIKAVCLFVFIHVTVPQNVFFIKLVSEEAGQTSLVKAGQRVFRWTEQDGGSHRLMCHSLSGCDALGHGRLGTLALLWQLLLIQYVYACVLRMCMFPLSL